MKYIQEQSIKEKTTKFAIVHNHTFLIDKIILICLVEKGLRLNLLELLKTRRGLKEKILLTSKQFLIDSWYFTPLSM